MLSNKSNNQRVWRASLPHDAMVGSIAGHQLILQILKDQFIKDTLNKHYKMYRLLTPKTPKI